MMPRPGSTTTTVRADTPKPKIFYGWWVLIGASALTFLLALVALPINFDNVIGAFKSDPAYQWNADRSLTYLTFGSLGAFISGLVGAPVVGLLLDRHGPRLMMSFLVLFTGAMLFLITQVQSELRLQVAVWCIEIGFFAIVNVVLVGTLGKWFVRRRALALAILSACSTFALAFSFAPIFAFAAIPTITAILTGVMVVIVGIAVALMMRREPEEHGLLPDGASECGDDHNREYQGHSANIRSLVRIPAFWQLSIAIGLALVAMHGLLIDPRNTGLYTTRIVDILILGELGVFLTTIGIVAIGFISLRVSKITLILVSFALMTVAYSGQVLIYLIGDLPFEYQAFSIFSVVVSVARSAIVILQFVIMGDYLGRRNFGTAVGMTISVNTVLILLILFPAFPIRYIANDIVSHNIAHLVFGMITIAIATYLVIKLEPQSRVAARIRLINRS